MGAGLWLEGTLPLGVPAMQQAVAVEGVVSSPKEGTATLWQARRHGVVTRFWLAEKEGTPLVQ